MPTYEYTCQNCHHAWEADQRITDEPVQLCPHCGEPKAVRLISQSTFRLAGKGWAVDGYSKP